MVDQIVLDYITQRKEKELKELEKKNETPLKDDLNLDEEKRKIEDSFEIKPWLDRMALAASQRRFASHPAKFVHSAITINEFSAFIARSKASNDGYVRTGNTETEIDSYGNAAKLEVDGFLRLKIQGQTVLDHFIDNTPVCRDLLSVFEDQREQVRCLFLSVIGAGKQNEFRTSPLAKQILFPISDDNEYVDLSILFNPGIMFKAKDIIKNEEERNSAEKLREMRNKHTGSDEVFYEYPNLTILKFGGTKPQNVSALNNRNQGEAYLFLSLPPRVAKREIRIPKRNLFQESISPWSAKTYFISLHGLFKEERNNFQIRNAIEQKITEIVDFVATKMIEIKLEIQHVTYELDFSSLDKSQKMLLFGQDERFDDETWIDDIVTQITRWINLCYTLVNKKEAFTLSDSEFAKIRGIVDSKREVLYI